MEFSGIRRKDLPIFLLLLALFGFIFPQMVLGASGESGGGGGVVVTPDSSTFIQMINFIFLIWVLNVLLYRPIRKILAQRKEKIDGLQLSIDTSDKDAKDKDDAYTTGIKEARARGFKEKETLMQEATDEEKKIIAEINNDAQAELAEVHENIKKEAEVARQSLLKEVDDFANQICQKILGRAV